MASVQGQSSARRDSDQGPAVAHTAPSQGEIARQAYGYWEARGVLHGSPQEDWYRAERA